MLVLELLALIALGTPTAQAPPTRPTAEVVVEARIIQLPALPETVEQARAEHGKLRPRLEQDLLDLERALLELYGNQVHKERLPTNLKVPRSQAEEVRFLARMLNDTQHAELEKAVLGAWEEWQSDLIGSGLATRSGDSAPGKEAAPAPLDQEARELKTRMAGMRKSDALLAAEASQRAVMTTLGSPGGRAGKGDPAKVAFLEAHASEVEERLQTTRQTVLINNRKAPKLATSWAPFAVYLNDCALKLNDLERAAPANPDRPLRALKGQARLHFLERYRSALWFSSVVWARMADATLPRPLSELEP
jgi:hypothetical protein